MRGSEKRGDSRERGGDIIAEREEQRAGRGLERRGERRERGGHIRADKGEQRAGRGYQHGTRLISHPHGLRRTPAPLPAHERGVSLIDYEEESMATSQF